MSVRNSVDIHSKGNIISLSYPKLMSDSDIEDFDVADILEKSGLTLRRFLVTKGLLQELTEVSDIGFTNHLV